MPEITQQIYGKFKDKDIVSFDQFSPSDIELLFKHVPTMKDIVGNSRPADLLKGKMVTLLFYEPSSRTFGSFAASVKRLGGQTVEIINPEAFSSVSKGETFEDTIKVFETYSDAIVLRHKIAGKANEAANTAQIPIINAGDGTGEHPTQALLDLYTIYEKHERLDNLIGIMVGDLLNGRTVHSLLRGLALYQNNTIYLLSPESLKLSEQDTAEFTRRGLKLIPIQSEKEIPKNAHFWYWTRVQKERFSNEATYEKVKLAFVATKQLLDTYGGRDTILMHPLPRVGEITADVDKDPRAVYLTTEIRNGLYVRMALLALVLGRL